MADRYRIESEAVPGGHCLSGAAAGVLYYVMPLVTGETLRARLVCEGTLPIADVVRLTGQIAAALDAAHRVGVIHRDRSRRTRQNPRSLTEARCVR